jgi:hypothetical protein
MGEGHLFLPLNSLKVVVVKIIDNSLRLDYIILLFDNLL